MSNLLEQLAEYLAEKLDMKCGTDVFYFEMPDEPNKCIGVIEKPSMFGSLSQLDASMHKVLFLVRDTSNTLANTLANKCYGFLRSDDAQAETTDTGFILLPNKQFIYVFLRGEPVWEKVDQKKRKTFSFEAIITTTKL